MATHIVGRLSMKGQKGWPRLQSVMHERDSTSRSRPCSCPREKSGSSKELSETFYTTGKFMATGKEKRK